ncbi:hypothetical protein SUGI_0755050 [Cryptomeria japonica]|nr:hypothetical protein SUGI_0755050 [Cryptomeria japonica]
MIGVQIYYSRHFKNYNQFQHCCRKARLIRQQGFASVAFNGGSEPKKVEVINTESKDSPLLAYVLYPGFPLNPKHYASFLQSCGNVEFLKQAHSHMVLCKKALFQFRQMQLTGVAPDSITMVSLLSACGHLRNLQQGKCVHNYIIVSGFESDVSIGNSLISMYAKCGDLEIAGQFFHTMSRRDVVSWNAMIAGYVQNGHDSEALMLFNQMRMVNVKPDSITMTLHQIQLP